MAVSRKRKAMDPLNPSLPSKRRLNTLRPRKDAIHPFITLAAELQLRILSYCDNRTLAAVSLVSNYFRELALRVLWETQPVEAFIQNFKQLDEHEDLRQAVRHFAIRAKSAPNKNRFSGVVKRLLQRPAATFLPGLTTFTIHYESITSDFFVAAINWLSSNKPNNLKTLDIRIGHKYTRSLPSLEDPTQSTITYPTGLTHITVCCHYTSIPLTFDPLAAFDANKDTLVTAQVYVGHWYPHFGLTPCLNVKTLRVKQDQFGKITAAQLAIKFPNVEKLILTAPHCGVMWPTADRARLMERYFDWRKFRAVKSVKIIYSQYARYGQTDVQFRDSVLNNIQYLVENWIKEDQMPALEEVECYNDAEQWPRQLEVVEMTLAFSFSILDKNRERVVELRDMVKLPGETKEEKKDEDEVMKDNDLKVKPYETEFAESSVRSTLPA